MPEPVNRLGFSVATLIVVIDLFLSSDHPRIGIRKAVSLTNKQWMRTTEKSLGSTQELKSFHVSLNTQGLIDFHTTGDL